MRENRTYGSEGGEPAMDNSPTPIYAPEYLPLYAGWMKLVPSRYQALIVLCSYDDNGMISA